MSIKFHLPDFAVNYRFNRTFVAMMQNCPEFFHDGVEIASFYGTFPQSLWNGGRAMTGICDKNYVKMVVSDFDKLTQLDEGMYVGEVVYGDFTADLTYVESYSDSLVVDEASSEPWSKGSVIITGSSATNQLAEFRNAKIGDDIDLKFYSKGKFTYRITDISYGLSMKEISELNKDNTLMICRSYYGFSTGNESKLFAVYTAEQV